MPALASLQPQQQTISSPLPFPPRPAAAHKHAAQRPPTTPSPASPSAPAAGRWASPATPAMRVPATWPATLWWVGQRRVVGQRGGGLGGWDAHTVGVTPAKGGRWEGQQAAHGRQGRSTCLPTAHLLPVRSMLADVPLRGARRPEGALWRRADVQGRPVVPPRVSSGSSGRRRLRHALQRCLIACRPRQQTRPPPPIHYHPPCPGLPAACSAACRRPARRASTAPRSRAWTARPPPPLESR